MARYILTAAVVGAPPNTPYHKYPRGTAIADTAGNAVAGDVVWPALCVAPSPVNMAPLDADASAVMGLPITTLASLATSTAGGACGENAGA